MGLPRSIHKFFNPSLYKKEEFKANSPVEKVSSVSKEVQSKKSKVAPKRKSVRKYPTKLKDPKRKIDHVL